MVSQPHHTELCTDISFSLKNGYISYLKQLGDTGAGLDPRTITKESSIANLIGMSQDHISKLIQSSTAEIYNKKLSSVIINIYCSIDCNYFLNMFIGM
jgi:hypothetical protein